jgi:hypothetical protein
MNGAGERAVARKAANGAVLTGAMRRLQNGIVGLPFFCPREIRHNMRTCRH